MRTIGFSQKEEATLATLTQDVLKSSEIEGEMLPYAQVHSSVAKRLGMDIGGLKITDRSVEGVVEMTLDATQNYRQPLTEERLFGWHAALFPTGRSGLTKIETGRYRTGEMQIVSGSPDRQKIHYEAPAAETVKGEMDAFLHWFNTDESLDPVLKAAVAHFWFIIIHPFDDGNGRMARALSDLLLARADESAERFYSLSGGIMAERKRYYEVLQKTQHSDGDITEWMNWFLHCLQNALLETENSLQKALRKTAFWNLHEHTILNDRQRRMLNRLLDGFEGKLQSSKWAKLMKTSSDTALRDLSDLVEKGILRQEQSGGRSTHYELVAF